MFKQLLKKRLSLGATLALILGVLVAYTAPAAFAASEVYRMVLHYYDPIQITYTLNYPAADKGPTNSTQDVPIGGVGYPGATTFTINPYIFSQVYCVDPFVPFHGQVAGLGGVSGSDQYGTMDSITGYTAAAPWEWSGALQAYGPAVEWIVTNGYRGTYNYAGTEDTESSDSVTRLATMFPAVNAISPITKEIAVMATKVAIWKVIAGDNVQVKSTTLDTRPAMRQAFDALVTALVNTANTAVKAPASLPTAVANNEITPTTFTLAISDTGATYDDSTNGDYEFYGPMVATATLDDAVGGDLNDMTGVFLTASGLNSTGVTFVTDPPNANSPLDNKLATAKLPGTNTTAQYVTGSATGDTWTSDPFYLAIPSDRTPTRGDQLMVNGMAKAPDITVQDGTPVVLSFAKNGIQDWNAIQSFVGATTGDQTVPLYAQTNWYTGDTAQGDLQIVKQVDNMSINDQDQAFTFAVYYSTDAGDTSPQPLNLSNFPVRGASSVNTSSTPNTFTLRNGSMGIIQGLPTTVSGGSVDEVYYYWVEEVTSGLPAGQYGPPTLVVNTGDDSQSSTSGSRIGPFTLDDTLDLGVVTITNTRLAGDLTITKALAGDFQAAGVDDTTEFSIIIRETLKDSNGKNYYNYLLFEDGSTPNTYTCVGNNGANDQSTAGVITLTAANPVTITNLWSKVPYKIYEINGNGHQITYSSSSVTITADQESQFKITNTYGGTYTDTGGAVVTQTGQAPLIWLLLLGGLGLGGWLLISKRVAIR